MPQVRRIASPCASPIDAGFAPENVFFHGSKEESAHTIWVCGFQAPRGLGEIYFPRGGNGESRMWSTRVGPNGGTIPAPSLVETFAKQGGTTSNTGASRRASTETLCELSKLNWGLPRDWRRTPEMF